MDQLKQFWKAARFREKAVIVLGLIYLLSPADLIPEIILGPLGLLDDAGALVVLITTLFGIQNRLRAKGHVIDGETVPPSNQ